MAERCEWCGAQDAEHTFEGPWRTRHYAGPVETVTWHVCNERCEALLREHVDATVRLGFDSLGGFLWWLLKAHLLWIGVPTLLAWGVAAMAGAPEQVVARVAIGVCCIAFGVAYVVWFYPVPIWANVRKPSSAILKVSLRSAERLCRLGMVLLLLVMVASGAMVLLLPK